MEADAPVASGGKVIPGPGPLSMIPPDWSSNTASRTLCSARGVSIKCSGSLCGRSPSTGPSHGRFSDTRSLFDCFCLSVSSLGCCWLACSSLFCSRSLGEFSQHHELQCLHCCPSCLPLDRGGLEHRSSAGNPKKGKKEQKGLTLCWVLAANFYLQPRLS